MAQDPRFPVITEVYRIGDAIAAAGGRPILVGGWVRDCLMGHPHSKDFDVEVFGMSPKALQKALSAFGPVHTVGRHFGVLKLHTREAEYDVSVPRRESKIGKGHKQFQVEPDPHMTFEEAAARRDFTINAMGYAFLEQALLDPHGGQDDLRLGMLRHVGPAFGEDPLRVLRAMQFAGRFGLGIAPETLAICRQQDLHELPRERLFEEFKKLLLRSAQPSAGLAYAAELGVLPYFPPLEALAQRDADWRATLAVVDAAATRRTGAEAEDLAVLLGALTHRMGPAPTWGAGRFLPPVMDDPAPALVFLRHLTHELDLLKRVQALLADLDTPGRLARQQVEDGPHNEDGHVRRLALRVSIPFLLRLEGACHQAANPQAGEEDLSPAGAWLMARAEALGVWSGAPQPLLQGRHLMERGVKPGPAMGLMLQAAFERQLDGHITTLEQALAWWAGKLAGGGK